MGMSGAHNATPSFQRGRTLTQQEEVKEARTKLSDAVATLKAANDAQDREGAGRAAQEVRKRARKLGIHPEDAIAMYR